MKTILEYKWAESNKTDLKITIDGHPGIVEEMKEVVRTHLKKTHYREK